MSALSLAPALILLVAGAFIPGCRPVRPTDGGALASRLPARPGTAAPALSVPARSAPSRAFGTGTPGQPDLHTVGDGDALLRLPAVRSGSPDPLEEPLPLLVILHGAGSDAAKGMSKLAALADELGVVLLAPISRSSTWDAVRGSYGADVRQINSALEDTFAKVRIDPGRIGVAGFSDGASYALGLGLANGDLFTRVLAFSPGFIPGGPCRGAPRFFVSHGIGDDILPIHVTARKIVPALESDGHPVTYREFDGGHAVPQQIAREALDWLGW
ncbi:alpha/beta hydrolase [Arthrobacter sunyaminii]|uniref:Phospholipase n=1 Tax=Arthrobacter sunyaminii TaxID=2816859 RepID=A0A975PFG2_9MICC|nr:PHB depolymerase family esterase [Arthrobacter sunyaminii]MBO0908414.1 hypothetical protein [Arthrobacter sunyaminii]QWQ36034.1 hypothetical protein KG104_16580 [Arthrobacter sunyaminii]